ncbi:hypothetical protein BDV09DRAFT_182122 [Aspergillus tetrazonus]
MFETLQPTAYAVSFIFYVLAFGLDDWWMVMVFVCNTAQQVQFCLFLQHCGGLFLLFAEEILYIWMQFVIKQAFMLFYLRLTSKTLFTYSVYATMVLNFPIAVGLWLLYCLQCQPLPAFWNSAAYPDATCLATAVTYYVPVSLNIITDFTSSAFQFGLWNIQASLSRRIGVLAVVTAGGIAVIVSCLRNIVLHQFAVIADFTYILGKMVITPIQRTTTFSTRLL